MSENREPLDEISVVTIGEGASDPETLRSGFGGRLSAGEVTNIKLAELAEGVNQFLLQMDSILKDIRASAGGFELSEVSVSAGVKASGKLTLFGVAGAESGVEGGLVFKFKRG
jgi:hypothetical protein